MRALPLLLLCAALSACDSYLYRSARFFDGLQRYGRAVEDYEAFLRRQPSGPRAVEAHLRAGWIYARVLGACPQARGHWEAAARLAPFSSPQAGRARDLLLSCPDYFPTEDGRSWTYGDSASRGRAMRLEWIARGQAISQELFAGAKRVRSVEARYERTDWEIRELSGGRSRAILRYPFQTGESWTSGRGGELERFRIVADDAVVKTAAGTFQGCLKVRDFRPSFSTSWTFDYYAPGVGKVKTTIAGPGFENPDTELLRYSD